MRVCLYVLVTTKLCARYQQVFVTVMLRMYLPSYVLIAAKRRHIYIPLHIKYVENNDIRNGGSAA